MFPIGHTFFFHIQELNFQTIILLEKFQLGTFATFWYREKNFPETIIYILCLIKYVILCYHEQVIQFSIWDEWIFEIFVHRCILFKRKCRRINSSLISWKISWVSYIVSICSSLIAFLVFWIQESKCPKIILLEKL